MRLLFLLAGLLLAMPSAAQDPRIDKVEPPNWWAGMNWNQVQLMVYGQDLAGAVAAFDESRIRVSGVHTLESPNYVFVDITIPSDLPPGDYSFTLRTAGGTVTGSYPIHARAEPEGRFQGFSADDVVYLITPDRFADGDPDNNSVAGLLDEYDRSRPEGRHGGDLQGIIDNLDYLQDLGVTALWLNPILENNGRLSYHGYAATDLYRVDARFGSNEDYRRLVDQAHARGLKIIFDHVNNHIGIGHRWISELPAESWLNGAPDNPRTHYKLATLDPYADPYSAQLLQGFWFVATMPDLNQRDPFLATYRIQNTLWWIEFSGMDGIREDTYPYPDPDYLARWADVILTEYPKFNIVGEIWEDLPGYLAAYQDGSQVPGALDTNLPSVMDFALTEAMRRYIRMEGKLGDLYKVLTQDFLYPDPDNLMTMFDNHDMARVIFEAGGHPLRVRQMMAFLLTTRGIPQILYGSEFGMMGGESHVELRADMPGGFPGDGRSVFTQEGRTEEENAMFDFTRALLHGRRDLEPLRNGALTHYPTSWSTDVYVYTRDTEDETVLVMLNGHEAPRTVALHELAWRFPDEIRVRDVATGREETIRIVDGYAIEDLGVRVFEVIR